MVAPVDAESDAARQTRRSLLADNLRLLHDALARTPIAGRFWLWGGLLLGAIREGDILLHDTEDADFAFLGEDVALLHAAFPALVGAGFRPLLRYPGATGPATEYTFAKDGQKFEFFRFELAGDRLMWCNYGVRGADPLQNVCAMPAQPLDELDFLGRPWLKTRDPDVELTTLYGDWRTPRPGFDYMEAPTIVERRPWDPSSYDRWGDVFWETGC